VFGRRFFTNHTFVKEMGILMLKPVLPSAWTTVLAKKAVINALNHFGLKGEDAIDNPFIESSVWGCKIDGDWKKNCPGFALQYSDNGFVFTFNGDDEMTHFKDKNEILNKNFFANQELLIGLRLEDK